MNETPDPQRITRTDEELRRFAEEHLLYEIKMFFSIAAYLRDQIVDTALANRDDRGLPARNALIEAFAIHGRALCDFFYGPNGKPWPDDVLATDYVERWEKPSRQNSLNRRGLSIRAGFEVAHLSYGRMNVESEAKEWPIDQIVNDMAPIVEAFAKQAPITRVGPDFASSAELAFRGMPSAANREAGTRASILANATVIPSSWGGGTATQLPGQLPTEHPSGELGRPKEEGER